MGADAVPARKRDLGGDERRLLGRRSLDDQLTFHPEMTHATEDDAPKLEFTALVREETDRDRLTYGKFRSNAEWFEFEPVLTVGRHEAELNDLPLLDANLRWIELELARVHCERDIGRPICGGR